MPSPEQASKPCNGRPIWRQWPFIPIPVLLVAIIGLSFIDTAGPRESPALLISLNLLLATLPALIIAALFARSFLASGALGLLLFGCGAVFWSVSGLSSLASTLAPGLGFDANAIVTIHNVAVWAAALCYLAGAALLERHGASAHCGFRLLAGYGLALAVSILVIAMALARWTPVFFVQGVGGSMARQFVLVSTIAALALTLVLLRPDLAERDDRFSNWFALALMLLIVGYVGIALQTVFGSLEGWISRAAQFLGGVYMIAAASHAFRVQQAALALFAGKERHVRAPDGVAIVIVLTATVLRLVFLPRLTHYNSITFYPAVVLAALYGGLRAGVVATILSALMIDYFLMEPVGSLVITLSTDWAAAAVFVATCIFLSSLAEKLRKTQARQKQELEALVAKRTEELTNEIAERKRAEGALRESEERLNMALAAAQAGFWEIRPDTGEFIASDQALALNGLPPGTKATPELAVAATCAEDRPRLLAAIDNARQTGAPYDLELRSQHPDGSIHWLHTLGALRNDGGVRRFIGLVQDITTRKQVEDALRKSEQRLQRLFSSGLVGLVYWNMNDEIVDANDKFLDMVGYERDDLTAGRINWRQMTPPEFAHLDERAVADLKANGVVSAPFEKEYFRKDGSRLPILMAGAMLDEARIDGVALVIDITERKRAEQQLEESETRFRAAQEASLDAFLIYEPIKDGGGKIVDLKVAYVNPMAANYCRSTPEQMEGRLISETLPGTKGPGGMIEQHGRIIESGRTQEYVLDYDADGIKGLFRNLVVRAGRYGAVTFRDITAEIEGTKALAAAKAEAERANIAKSKFLAAASHDLRQPVQSLTLLLSAIEGQVKDRPKAANIVNLANASMDSLNRMLTGILDISRLDAGVIAPAFESAEVDELVDRLAGEYAPRAAAIGLVQRHVRSGLRVRTDVALLERILRNLIENALRFTAKGGFLIGARQRGEFVRLDVIDTGIGIPAKRKTEIFEEFRQLNNPARDSSQGLGLGLAIVSRLARLIGAEVQVSSRVGHGTRFSLLLPLERSAPAPVRHASAFDHAGGRILIIEDDSGVRQAYEIMLEDWGHETLSAASGEEALDRAAEEKWRFDAILSDQRLGPGLSGAAAAKEIARRAGRALPTLLVTGDTAENGLVEAFSSGFVVLHKPVDAGELRRSLTSLLLGAEGRGRSAHGDV